MAPKKAEGSGRARADLRDVVNTTFRLAGRIDRIANGLMETGADDEGQALLALADGMYETANSLRRTANTLSS